MHQCFPSGATLFAKAMIGSIAGGNTGLGERAAASTQRGPGGVGGGIVRSFVSLWVAAGGDDFTAVVRAAIEGDGTIEPFRDFIAGGILQPIVTRFCPDRPELRAQLIASQIIGLGMARWVAGLDQVSPLEAESLASLVGPTIQRYLLDELPDTPLDS